MRSRNIHHINEFLIHIRLVVPCIYDYSTELGQSCLQGLLIYNLTSGSVYEDGALLHHGKEPGSGHSPGDFIQRDMQGDNIGVLEKILKRAEAFNTFRPCARRIASEHIEPQIFSHFLDLTADIPYTYDTYRAAVYLYTLTRSDTI